MERLPGIFTSFFLLCWIACIFPFCFIINGHNENPWKVYTCHQDTMSVSLSALFLKALDYVRNIVPEKTSMETNVIKIVKAISLIQWIHWDGTPRLALPSLCEPIALKEIGANLATFWVSFVQLSKKFRPCNSLNIFKGLPIRFPTFSCTLWKFQWIASYSFGGWRLLCMYFYVPA